MEVSALLDRIRQEQNTFSAAQKLVAAYVLENHRRIPFLSITELSQRIGVSDNTVVKFCNRIGYTRFSEFKKEFAEHACSELVVFNKMSASAEIIGSDSVFEAEMNDSFALIQTALTDSMNQKNLEPLAEMMNKARAIYITGGRASGKLGEFLAIHLRYLGFKVYDISDSVGDYLDKISMIGPEDLVIAFSFARYTGQVVDALNLLHEDGVPIVLFTDYGISPARPFASLVFQCSLTSSYFLYSYTGCVALMSAICRYIGQVRRENAMQHMKMLEQRLVDNEVFHNRIQ